MKQSLKERLLAYLQKHPTEWCHSGELQRIVAKYTSYSPQNTGRRLRELENDGVIEVRYEKGAAIYRIKQKVDWRKYNQQVLASFDS